MFRCIRCGEIMSSKGALKNHLNKKYTCNNVIIDINLYEYQNLLSLSDKEYKNELLKLILKKLQNVKGINKDYLEKEELKLENEKLKKIIDEKNKIIELYKKNINMEEENDEEYIYIIKEREFVKSKENVYKLGMTKNVKNRMGDYPRGSRIKDITSVKDAKKSEQDLLIIFRTIFIQRSDIGTEYFQGDLDSMRNQIHNYAYNSNI
jgi:hypothetical protein